MDRVLNFYAGPTALPLEALESAKNEMFNWKGTGMSVLEISHRSKEYTELHNETKDLLRKLLAVPGNYEILMLQGGASLQFAMIPMNLLENDQTAGYIVTGRFSSNAFKNAEKLRKVYLSGSTEENGIFSRLPGQDEINIKSGTVYCHLTSNNTIFGTQWKVFPETGPVPLVCDMSSDILSRKINFNPFGLVYAGAQKNLGPAGLAVIIIRDDMLERSRGDLPDILSYRTHVDKNSLYNTPSCFATYMMNKVLKWVEKGGGLGAVETRNEKKAELLYGVIDKDPGFFKSRVQKECRSSMNVTFNLPSEELESRFISNAQKIGIVGIKGHRSVGGVRVSMYNTHGTDDIEVLVDSMKDFIKRNG
jgi:phosphoserine aminotransferase